jgi:hypothetical protein
MGREVGEELIQTTTKSLALHKPFNTLWPPPYSQLIRGYSFKDDVTVSLLLGVSFMPSNMVGCRSGIAALPE